MSFQKARVAGQGRVSAVGFPRRGPSPRSREPDAVARELDGLRGLLADARRILVMTGAGISASAGLPTYRGPGGIYEADEALPALLQAGALRDNLPAVWQFLGPRRDDVRSAVPTAAHLALAAWQRHRSRQGVPITLVTANIDDLHERAGSDPVHHLHGNVFATTCLSEVCPGRIARDERSDGSVPPCAECGGPTRPGVVLFGEQVDVDAQWAAKRTLRECDVFLCVGTSGTVSPSPWWLRHARDVGGVSVLVNPDPAAGEGFDRQVLLDADVALPVACAVS